jgi:hypothetical protein
MPLVVTGDGHLVKKPTGGHLARHANGHLLWKKSKRSPDIEERFYAQEFFNSGYDHPSPESDYYDTPDWFSICSSRFGSIQTDAKLSFKEDNISAATGGLPIVYVYIDDVYWYAAMESIYTGGFTKYVFTATEKARISKLQLYFKAGAVHGTVASGSGVTGWSFYSNGNYTLHISASEAAPSSGAALASNTPLFSIPLNGINAYNASLGATPTAYQFAYNHPYYMVELDSSIVRMMTGTALHVWFWIERGSNEAYDGDFRSTGGGSPPFAPANVTGFRQAATCAMMGNTYITYGLGPA